MHWRQKLEKRTHLWVWTVLGALMLVLVAVLAQPVLAAIQLSYFYVISNPTSVVLQWGTASEFNVEGFEIQCKLASEPDIAYHRIGFVPAKGGPSTPAQYNFPVTTGIEPGTAYCWRLQELTTDGTPGEAQDRCGYGPNVTPTPGAPGIIPTTDPNVPAPAATDAFGNPIVQPQPTDAFGNPIVQPQATDAFGSPLSQPAPTDAFGNPIVQPQSVDPFGNPIVQPQATDAFGSPLPQPVPTDAFGNPIAQPTDAFGNPIAPSAAQPQATDAFGNPIAATDAFGNPILPTAPQPQAVDQFGNPIAPTDAFGSPLATPTFTPDPMLPPTPIIITPQPGDASALQPPPQDPALAQVDSGTAANAEVQPAEAAPPVAYVVVTAAPTEAPVALGAAMTPLPTVTPTPPVYQLVNALTPTTQNLMVMLLCLTFTGASGIGILGLITSVMFMRSRSGQREFYDRYSPPRRRPW